MKTCQNPKCKREFARAKERNNREWASRKYCSIACGGVARGIAHRSHLQEEVAWIVDHDHPESVAKRVGYGNAKNLISKLRKTGAPELADKLARNLERYTKGEISYSVHEDVEMFA